jgi:hypothetical protein
LLIPYDRLPETIKNTPSVKKALKKFTPASGQPKQEVKAETAAPKDKKVEDLRTKYKY